MLWSRYGMKWPTISRRSLWEDGWSGKTSVTLTGRVCPWLNHPIKEEREGSLFSEPLDDDFTVVSPPKDQPPWRRTNQVRSRKCLYYRRKWTARYQARHQRTNWALLTAPFGWWHPQENQAQRAPIRSTCSRWTTKQWDVDGSPPH